MSEKASGSAAARDVEALGEEIAAAIARIYRRFRSERVSGDLGDAATAVLILLHKKGPQTLTALSEHEHVTPASMSQVVNRLTTADYAARSRDPQDGRKVLLSATPLGSELVIAARARRYAWFSAQLAELPKDDRAALARAATLLRQIADS